MHMARWLLMGWGLGWGMCSGAAPALQTVNIRFLPTLAGQPASCGAPVEGQGLDQSVITLADLRMFVSDMALIDNKGKAVPVQLVADGVWQADSAAMLDFEDATGNCANGTVPQHRAVVGRVPAGRYRGLQFTVGLPARINHQDATLAPSPFNQTAMFWSWQAGYRFIKLELDVNKTGQADGFPIHIGSTGCQSDSTTTPPTHCLQPNRVSVKLARFDPRLDQVQIDLSALLAQTRLQTQAPHTAPGCMAAVDDPDCEGVLSALGLRGTAGQMVFKVWPR
ncbi:MbnP family copper-binding protein [Chitinivorax tropicus]|nr:MbnP family copper-binding protein [Chitinivorax tropicus]